MPNIRDNLIQVHKRIDVACQSSGRASEEVQLLAVSKTKPAADLRQAYAAGQRAFGENYLQEALEKQQQLVELDIEWHFIGPIQSNKTRAIAENFDWIHSVEREKIALRLNQQRPPGLTPLNICLQVNLDRESSKSGVNLAEIPPLLESLANLPNICVRGLMAIPARRDNFAAQKSVFDPLREMLDTLRPRYPQLDTLSIGMSADLEAAIAAGATVVRIGTDIFGRRETGNN